MFPRELLIPYTYQIINDISQGVNAWDCLAQLLSSIHDIKFTFDLTQCNINFQDEIFNPRVPVSVIHQTIYTYISYLNIRKYTLKDCNLTDILAKICVYDNQLNRIHQTHIGEVIFDELFMSSFYYRQIFIPYAYEDRTTL